MTAVLTPNSSHQSTEFNKVYLLSLHKIMVPYLQQIYLYEESYVLLRIIIIEDVHKHPDRLAPQAFDTAGRLPKRSLT